MRSVIPVVLLLCQSSPLFGQAALLNGRAHPSNKSVSQQDRTALPKPAVAPAAGTWKYSSRDDVPANPNLTNDHSTSTVTVKDDGDSWTITSAWEFPAGPVTDVLTLDKATLAVRKEVFRHFLHTDQPWKPIAIDLDFSGNKVNGVMKYVDRPDKQVATDLSGPLFAVSSVDITVACLPLTAGYATTFRYFDVERLALKAQAPDREKQLNLRVVGAERVTVPAGTFDSWRVELTSPDGSSKESLWISKDSRTPVKSYAVQKWRKGARVGTSSTITELVP
ncbi:MAG TPA: hypothetical protein VFR84_12295 [Candidatus Angelobacter sp.]|nr:hypothetical protein [Candidatus Angelobacter sp.]